jgi:hypothetical protein
MVAARNAATSNDFPNEVCRKFQRRTPQETPQQSTTGPTKVAARFNDAWRSHAAAANDRRRRKCRNRAPQKNRPQSSPGKDRI